MLGTMMKMDEE